MSNRTLRVNELLQRELSDILRKQYKDDAVRITITGIEVTPDLREGKVHLCVLGDEDEEKESLRWLQKHAQELRFELGRRVVLKHMPVFTYHVDTSTTRGNRILAVLDEIAEQEKTKPAGGPPPASAPTA
jgi:ribosome-binding factor A